MWVFRLLAEASTSARLTCLSWLHAISPTRPRSTAQHDTHPKAARNDGGSVLPDKVQAGKAPSGGAEVPAKKKATVVAEATKASGSKKIKTLAGPIVPEVSKPKPLKAAEKVSGRRKAIDALGSTVEQTHSAGKFARSTLRTCRHCRAVAEACTVSWLLCQFFYCYHGRHLSAVLAICAQASRRATRLQSV